MGNSPGPANSPHKGPVTRKMFPFDDFIMVRVNFERPAKVTAKYERSLRYLTYNFAKSKFSVTWELTNGALVTSITELSFGILGNNLGYFARYPNTLTHWPLYICMPR